MGRRGKRVKIGGPHNPYYHCVLCFTRRAVDEGGLRITIHSITEVHAQRAYLNTTQNSVSGFSSWEAIPCEDILCMIIS